MYLFEAIFKAAFPKAQRLTQRVNTVTYWYNGGIFDRSWVAVYSLGRLPSRRPVLRSVDRNGQVHREGRSCGCATAQGMTWFVFADRTSFANSMKTHIFRVSSIPCCSRFECASERIVLTRTKERVIFPQVARRRTKRHDRAVNSVRELGSKSKKTVTPTNHLDVPRIQSNRSVSLERLPRSIIKIVGDRVGVRITFWQKHICNHVIRTAPQDPIGNICFTMTLFVSNTFSRQIPVRDPSFPKQILNVVLWHWLIFHDKTIRRVCLFGPIMTTRSRYSRGLNSRVLNVQRRSREMKIFFLFEQYSIRGLAVESTLLHVQRRASSRARFVDNNEPPNRQNATQ